MLEGLGLEAIFEQAKGPIALFDLHGRFRYVNGAFCRLLGFGREQLLGRHSREFTHPHDPAMDPETIEKILAGQCRDTAQKRFIRSDGSVAWVLLSLSVIHDSRGELRGFLSQMHDVTAHPESERLWHRTFANAPIGMALLSLDGRWTAVNDALCSLLGYRRDALLGSFPAVVAYPDDDGVFETALAELVEGRRDTVSVERRYRHNDGHPMCVLIRLSAVPRPDGSLTCLVGQYEAIGDGRMADAHLAHLALHDPLTGLANRALLADRLEHQLAELAHDGGAVAVLLADLDDFKPINDRYGHAIGDEVLTATANELLGKMRTGDTVARLGGDEFVVVRRVSDEREAEELRDSISGVLDRPSVLGQERIRLRASVGLAVTADSGTRPCELLDAADRDMYARKSTRREAARTA